MLVSENVGRSSEVNGKTLGTGTFYICQFIRKQQMVNDRKSQNFGILQDGRYIGSHPYNPQFYWTDPGVTYTFYSL